MKDDAISDKAQMAIGALISLGFKKKEAEAAINQTDTSLSVEQMISNALKKLCDTNWFQK